MSSNVSRFFLTLKDQIRGAVEPASSAQPVPIQPVPTETYVAARAGEGLSTPLYTTGDSVSLPPTEVLDNSAEIAQIFPNIDLSKLSPIELDFLRRSSSVSSGLSTEGLKSLLKGSSFDTGSVAQQSEAARDLSRLGPPGTSPYAPSKDFFQGMPSFTRGPLSPVTEPIRQPLIPVSEPLGAAPSPGFSAVVPDFTRLPAFATQGFKRGGSVSRRELDALPGYQAGGLALLPRVLPSERKFMDERLAEYDVYNKGVEGYNTAYDKYVADVDAYNRAAEAYNVGPRTEDFTMAEPVFGGVVPAAPSMAPEQFQAYQEGARRRALNRSSALEEAINRGIVSPDIARILTRGPT